MAVHVRRYVNAVRVHGTIAAVRVCGACTWLSVWHYLYALHVRGICMAKLVCEGTAGCTRDFILEID